MEHKLISQGAEAKIFLTDKVVLKSRVPKSYRHTVLDEQLRKKRTKAEAKILQRVGELGVCVPKVLRVDTYEMQLEYLSGERLSETLSQYPEAKQFSLMRDVGRQLALLHDNDLIHGDLTTSNLMLVDGKVFFIDFGLGFISKKLEDRAVDLHVFKQALEANHFMNHKELYAAFLETYRPQEREDILKRLEAVEKRGRYRH